MTRLAMFVSDPSFKPDTMMQKSVAAANICTWAINMLAYAKIYKKVCAPLGCRCPVMTRQSLP